MDYNKIIKEIRQEETFNDCDYADYEVARYEEEAENDLEYKKKNEYENMHSGPGGNNSDYIDFYKTYVEVERGEISRKRYAELARLVREGSKEQKQQAREEACFYMKGFVKDFLKVFSTYIANDASYAEDLEQEAYCNIIKYLPEYDHKRALPSTFFYHHIKSAMVASTNRMKHSTSASDATLQRKIKKIQAEYKLLGRTPTVADYAIETGKTMSKIRSVLQIMEMGTVSHLDAIVDYDQFISGDPSSNDAFENPESQVIKKVIFDSVIQRMLELFTKNEVEIFIRNTVNNESIPTIAASLGAGDDDKIRRLIEKIRHATAYDTEIRSLCSSYIKNHDPNLNIVTILPIQGENENMDLLETIEL